MGEWLPEPLLTDPDADTAQHAETADSLSLAFLVLLESLTRSSGRSSCSTTSSGMATTRSRTSWARARTTPASSRCARGATWTTSGRGSKPRARNGSGSPTASSTQSRTATPTASSGCWPTTSSSTATAAAKGRPGAGRSTVATTSPGLLLGLGNQLIKAGARFRRTEINGQPGALFLDREGQLINIFSLDVADGTVQTIRSIANPEKLAHLGPVADVRALLREIQDARGPD